MERSKIITEKQILVKEVLTSPVITVNANACIPLITQLMNHYEIGSVVVTNNQGNHLGIITERDLVVRILTRISDNQLVNRVLETGTCCQRTIHPLEPNSSLVCNQKSSFFVRILGKNLGTNH